jgi:hypothetical protein
LALALALLAGAAAAQQALEILTLRHRTADQVMPALRPLLEPGATLSGQGNRLFVRASAANLDDLRLALEALDRPARRLQISVRFDASREQSQASAEERVDQRVQALEGARAVIYSGRARPVRQRIQTPGGVIPQEITVLHDQATGFEVVPRVSGKGLTLEIAAPHGAQYLATTVHAELGQWVDLGSTGQASAYRSELQGVWLKVEEIPN